jgi:hypothetical protein
VKPPNRRVRSVTVSIMSERAQADTVAGASHRVLSAQRAA